MTDEHLRELERRWQQTGSAADEAKLLAEHVRLGRIRTERLELAALLGHEAAAMVTGRPRVPARDGDELLRLIAPFDKEPLVRAAVAIARAVFPTWATYRNAERGDPIDLAIRAAEAWCLESTAERTQDAHLQAQSASEWLGVQDDEYMTAQQDAAAGAASCAAYAAGTEYLKWPAPERMLADRLDSALSASREARLVLPDEDLRAAVSRELIPWALGRSDPLRDSPTGPHLSRHWF